MATFPNSFKKMNPLDTHTSNAGYMQYKEMIFLASGLVINYVTLLSQFSTRV